MKTKIRLPHCFLRFLSPSPWTHSVPVETIEVASAAVVALQRVVDFVEAPREEASVEEVDLVVAEAVPAEADLILRRS